MDLVVLDFVVGPEALRDEPTAGDAQSSSDEPPRRRATLGILEARSGAIPTSPLPAPATAGSPTNGDVPTRTPAPGGGRRVVARFDSESPIADDTELRALAASMLADPTAEIVLEGHSDQRGDPERNRMLSLERAKWAQARLGELGVSASRIAVVGVGAERPREIGEDDAAVASNRRVEVRWITGTPPSQDGDR